MIREVDGACGHTVAYKRSRKGRVMIAWHVRVDIRNGRGISLDGIIGIGIGGMGGTIEGIYGNIGERDFPSLLV